MSEPITTPAETRATEDFSKAFHGQWDGWKDPVIKVETSEMPQIRRLLRAYIAKIFGGDEELYEIGFFTDQDMGTREATGYRPLTVGMFPRDEHNKPTWSDGIAARMRLTNHADGTIRWGSRSELYVCVIRHDIRESYRQKEKEAQARLMNRHLQQGKASADEDADGMESDVEITKEVENIPRKRRSPRRSNRR